MNIFEMMRAGDILPITVIVPVKMVAIMIVCVLLARSKNRNLIWAAALGVIPFINYLTLAYYVGVPVLHKGVNEDSE